MSASSPGRPDVPPIPVSLQYVPTVAGLVVPFVTATNERGQPILGAVNAYKQRCCLVERRCQVCGQRLDKPIVLLLRRCDLDRKRTVEPAMHPVCAVYTIRACPMVNGQMRSHRQSLPKIAEGWRHGDDVDARLGQPAEPWFAAWLRSYDLVTDAGQLAAAFDDTHLLRVRPVTP